jgi:O-antigen/teichoic acid export membrane protein
MAEVRRMTALLSAVCVAAGLAGIAGAGLFGPWVLTSVMGAPVSLSAALLMELATGTLFLLVANILQSALTALNRQQTVLVAWSLGVVAMFIVFAVPLGPLTTAAVASLVGPAVTMLVMAWDVLRATGGLRAVSDVNQGKDQPVAQPAK